MQADKVTHSFPQTKDQIMREKEREREREREREHIYISQSRSKCKLLYNYYTIIIQHFHVQASQKRTCLLK
jgi:hypothetical protein